MGIKFEQKDFKLVSQTDAFYLYLGINVNKPPISSSIYGILSEYQL